MTMSLGKGHRLSFGIGGVDDVDLLDRRDVGDIGAKVRGPRTSETRFGVRGSRFHIRFSFCRHFSLCEIVRPRDPIVLLRRAPRAPTRERGADALPTIIFASQAMVGETRDAADGFEIDDRERTPQSKTKGSTAVLRKSPNNVFSPLSIMSEATAPGDKSFDSSFSDEHVADGAIQRDIPRQSAGVDAPSSPRDDVEVGVSMSLTSTVGDEDEEDLSHSWLRRRRVSGAVAPALSANAPLLTSLAPSADEAMTHRRVSELRIALRAAEGTLEKTRARFEDSESARHEAESESAALRARVWTLEGAEALSGARLHDGTLDLLRGELLNEATAELEEAARATADAEARARDAIASLRQAEDAAAAVVSAANAEVESLSLEAAQARFRAQAESRDAATAREARARADAGRADAEAEASKWRDIGERATADRTAAEEAARVAVAEAEEAREAAAAAKAREAETTEHNNWLQSRLRELEDAEGTDAGAHYGAELRRLREKLAVDAAKAADALAVERAARRELEAKLSGAIDVSVPDASVAALEEQLRVEREETAKLRERLAAIGAASPGEDSWADALGLLSDEEASEKGDAVSANPASEPARAKPAAESKEIQVSDTALEDARREIDELKGANAKLLEQQQAAAAVAAAAASPAAIDAALSRNNEAWATKLAHAELVAVEAEEKVERAARRVKVLEAECAAAQRELMEIRERELAVEDKETAVARAVQTATAEAEMEAEKKWSDQLTEAMRSAADAQAKLARVVEAEEEREREAVEAEKEWEEKLTEARQTAAEAEAKRSEAEMLVVEAKEAATRAILRVEEEQVEKLEEARRAAAIAEAKMAEAEASAAEAKEAEANAAVRVAELEKACAEAHREIELMREHEATAKLAAEAEAAFAALEAGEEAKMEAAEALAEARAEALTARGELDALRESLRLSGMHSAPVAQPVAPSPTATPSQSVFDEPHKSSESPMRPHGVTVVQMTDDETETESCRDDHEESPIERALRRDREELVASVPSTPLQTRFTAAAAAADAEARASPVAESRRAATVARRIHVDPEVLRSLTSSPRASGLVNGGRMSRVATHPTGVLTGGRISSSGEEDDVCRMSSEDESDAASTRGRARHPSHRSVPRDRSPTPPRLSPARSDASPTRIRSSTVAEWREERDAQPSARSSVSETSRVAHGRASEAFAAVAASAQAAATAATAARRGPGSRVGSAHATPAKPSPAKRAAAALAETPIRRSPAREESALQALRASRVSIAAMEESKSTVASRRRAAAQTTGRSRGVTDTWGRPTGTWGHPSPTGIRQTAMSGRNVTNGRAKNVPPQASFNHRYA